MLLLLDDSCFCATMLVLLMLADSCLLEIALDSCWTLTASPILARETDSRAREDDLRWK